MRRTWKSGPWPNEQCSLWEGVHEQKQVALRYAQLLKTICPSLQYVRFQDWAWQISLARESLKTRKQAANTSNQHEMFELDWESMKQIHIFAKDPVSTQCGLSQVASEGPQEVDWVEFAAWEKILQARRADWRDSVGVGSD